MQQPVLEAMHCLAPLGFDTASEGLLNQRSITVEAVIRKVSGGPLRITHYALRNTYYYVSYALRPIHLHRQYLPLTHGRSAV
jgi:hypothetical protein